MKPIIGRTLKESYQRLKPCIVGICVELPDGSQSIGTGFHIGDGFIATARHVVEGVRIKEFISSSREEMKLLEIYYPSNPLVDVAILRTTLRLREHEGPASVSYAEWTRTDHLQIAVEWDDFIGDPMVMDEVLVMGYPPVPTVFPTLIGIRAEINAVVDQYPMGGEASTARSNHLGNPAGRIQWSAGDH